MQLIGLATIVACESIQDMRYNTYSSKEFEIDIDSMMSRTLMHAK